MAQKFIVPITIKQLASAGSDALTVFVNDENYGRVKLEAGGRISWSDGTGTHDTNLYRDSANVLATDDVFKAVSGVITMAVNGVPTASLPNGALAVDILNNAFYFRSNSTWTQVTGGGGGASLTVGDTAPASPSVGDLWFESDTAKTFVYYDSQWVEIGGAGPQGPVGPTGPIDTLSDVTITSVALNDVIAWNGSAWVNNSALLAAKAPLASPSLTGTPTAPTAAGGTNTTQIATTAFVATAVSGATITSLDDVSDVTITSATSGQFLKWNGSVWVNDAIDLGTDTTGNYVATLTAGTGITLANNSGEGASPTVTVDTAVIQARVTNVTDTEIGYLDGVTSAIQTQIDTKAPLASPTLTGVPAAPTATAGNNSTQIATTAYADAAVAAIVDSAPATLNTLNELADALGDDANFATTTATAIGLKAPLASPTFTGTVTIPTGASITAPTGLVKGDVGLGSVDNTADTAKPVSTAQQTALDLKANLAGPTFTGTVTVPTPIGNTDASTKAYVDSTASTTASNASTALTNHDADTTNIHGIVDTSILVTTTGTQTLTNKTITSPSGLVKGDVGLGNVDNTSDANKPVSTAGQTALDLKANLASPTFTGTVVLPDNTVALGTKTTGDYVATITGGTGVASTAATTGEGTTHTLSIGQAVGTTDNVTFAGVTADAIKVGVTTANEIDTTSGDLTIDSAGGTVTVDDNLVVTGNLTVSGTTTSINTETLTVDDNIVILNNNVTGSPTENAGIEIERGTSTNVSLRWNETTDKWEFTNDGSAYSNLGAGGATISDTAPASPTAGQIWFQSTNGKTFVYYDSQWIEVGGVGTGARMVSSSSAPASPLEGSMWFDTDTAQTFVYYDSSWIEIGASGITASVQDSAPASPVSGQIWFNSLTGGTYVYYGTNWIEVGASPFSALINTINAKGDLLVGTADNTLGGLTAGSANQVLTVDSSTATGLKWSTPTVYQAVVANVSDTEIGYLDGVTSAIQTQINAKASTGKAIAMAIVFGG